LTLPQFRQPHPIDRPLAASGADDAFRKLRTKALLIDLDGAHITVEDVSALGTLKVNNGRICHVYILLLHFNVIEFLLFRFSLMPFSIRPTTGVTAFAGREQAAFLTASNAS
jgi:hypothetical protein